MIKHSARNTVLGAVAVGAAAVIAADTGRFQRHLALCGSALLFFVLLVLLLRLGCRMREHAKHGHERPTTFGSVERTRV
ncbi:MAG: hypothetical protein ABI589_12785, partial [Burkholderiales bacterium]